MRLSKAGIVAIIMLFITSCNSLRYVPEAKQILESYQIDWNSVDLSKKEQQHILREIQEVLSPSPNSTLFGMRLGLWANYRTEKEKGRWVTRYINRRYGEKPVYIDEISTDRLEKLISNRLENNGFFFHNINFKRVSRGKNTARLIIKITASEPYRLLDYQVDSSELYDILSQIIIENALLQENDIFRLEDLKKERVRIQNELRNKGYYYFSADHLVFEMDTINTTEFRRFTLHLKIKDGVQPRSIEKYSIGSIDVVVLGGTPDSLKEEAFYRGVQFNDETYFKSKRMRPLITLQQGELYRLSDQRQTGRYLNSLRNFGHANMRFNQSDSAPEVLDVSILLTPSLPRSFRAELQALTRSNNFAGPALNLTYSNRNIFRGGEVFRISTVSSFETQLGSGFAGAYSYELGIRGELDLPRVLFRGDQKNYTSYSLPRTRISLGSNFLRRAGFYTLNTLQFRTGYYWQSSERKTHSVEIVDLIYSNLFNTSESFEEILNANPFLRRSFEQQFIPAVGYTYTYSQLASSNKSSRLFVLLHGESSGNLSAILPGLNEEIAGVPISRFLKTEADIRLNQRITRDRNIVLRYFTGVGVSFGNSTSLPFVKQYFSGGPNSIRAFRIRALGPGGYLNPNPDRLGAFFDQAGDIQLEANIEYRFPIASVIKGAWFIDAGNIWLLNENPALPNGAFSSEFMQQIAIGGGFGLRLDLNIMVIRFDFATPIRAHAVPDDQSIWRINDFNPLRRNWYKDGLLVNFALGYPF